MRDTHASTSTWKGCGMALAVLYEGPCRCRAVQAHHGRRVRALLLLQAQIQGRSAAATDKATFTPREQRAKAKSKSMYMRARQKAEAAIADRAEAQQAMLAKLSWARHLETPQQQQCALQRPECPAATPPCLLVFAHVQAAVPTHWTGLSCALCICK